MAKTLTKSKRRGIEVPDLGDLGALNRTQALFDKIVRGARRTGYVLCMDQETHECRYRGEDGNRCLVGLTIPKREYKPEMEGKTPIMLRAEGLYFTDLDNDTLHLLEEMQGIHDDSEPEEWEERFAEIAEDYGLAYSPPRKRRRK